MANVPVLVTRWSDLQAAGGECLGACWPWHRLETERRLDGDDRLTGALPTDAEGAADLTDGDVLRLEFGDGTVEEWIVAETDEAAETEFKSVVALPARVWLEERVLLRDGADLELSGSGTVEAVLDAMIATDEWPSWIIRGTVDRNPTVSYQWSQSKALPAILALVAAANATELLALEGETARFAFRRVSSSQWAIDILTGPASGTPALIEDRNIKGLRIRRERVQRAAAIYPLNADGVTITEAMFAVRTSASNILDMRDWAYRPDFLGVAFDGQWVGAYAIAPNGTVSQIVDSWLATQQIEVADGSAWGAGNNATVRIALANAAVPTLAVVDTDILPASKRRALLLPGTWSAKINWLPNSRWDEWTSATVIKDWSTAGGMTTNRVTDRETGAYAVEIVTGGSTGDCQVLEVLMPNEVVTNNGGTQTWRVGVRYKNTVQTGGSIALQVSRDGGATWTAASIGVVGNPLNTWLTADATFTTTASHLPNRPRLRFSSTAIADTKTIVDRVWLFRDGVDTGDDTLIGNGPSVGFYTAQRELLRYRQSSALYEVQVADRYRHDPTTFATEQFAVGQEARLMVPSRGLDLSVPIVQLRRDELHPLATTLQLGATRRRLIDTLRG